MIPHIEPYRIDHASEIVLVFSLCAFAGWLIEVAYRSFHQKRFVNAGFLSGPFLPIYGLGALFVLSLDPLVEGLHPLVRFAAYGLVLTAVEYAIGALSEKLFGLVLWDYSQNRLNLHGRVCMLFSLFWAAIAFGFRQAVYPPIDHAVKSLDVRILHISAAGLVAYFVLDFAASAAVLQDFVARLSSIHLKRIRFSTREMGRLDESFRRLLTAFPNLKGYLEASFRHGIRSRIDEKVSELHRRFFQFVDSRHPRDEEFRSLVRDIARHWEFLRLKEFRHHDDTIYNHALKVALISYRIGKYLNLDYRAVARGGLLHDFFLYDWRNHDLPDLAREKFHGLEHPRIALRNAERHFEVGRKERDIILKHMWPLTPRPPRFRESLLVTLVDKYVSTKEFWSVWRERFAPRKALR